MILNVALLNPVLVLPTTTDDDHHREHDFDAPPPYLASSLVPNASSTSLLLGPSSSSPSGEASTNTTTSSSTKQHTVTANITLKVPSGSSCSTLTSLTARLMGSESLAFNSGQFEQSWPVDIRVSAPLPEHFILQAGKTYSFQAEIPCPANMSPSVQLSYGRMKYKVRVRAKVRSTGSILSRSLLPSRTLTAEEPLFVMQASRIETDAFSKIKYVSIDGLGSTCISLSPLPLLLGETTNVMVTLPDEEAKARIQKVELSVIQDTRIRLRSASFSSSSRTQARPYIHHQLAPIKPDDQSTLSGPFKESELPSRATTSASNVLEAKFSVPTDTDLQPTTLPGSDAAILLSHRLVLSITYAGTDGDADDQPKKFACSWPTTLAHPQAVSRFVVDELPRYTQIDATAKACEVSSQLADPCPLLLSA